MSCYLTLDLGGTFIKYGLIEQDELVAKGKMPTEKEDFEKFLHILDSIQERYTELEGICISMPGCIDTAHGIAITGGHLKFINQTPLKQLLEERYGIHVHIANDGHCATAAEVWKGSLQNIDNGAVMVFGSGIAGGLLIDGNILRGSNYAAGEFSCILTNMKSFNHREFLGYDCSSKGILRSYYQKYGNKDTGEQFFQRVLGKETSACQHLKECCLEIASAIVTLQAMLDLKRISIGGGISEQGIFITYLKEAYLEICKLYKDFPIYPIDIVACMYHNDANLLGAYYFFKKEEKIEC